MSHAPIVTKSIRDTLDRICNLSEDTYYNPYKTFDWPDELPDEQWWMSRELMSVAGTKFDNELSEKQLMALSKWESVHFYSLNVHGIRELLLEVVGRVQMPGFEIESEYFSHFIGEENDHLWFFATFCNKYGKKIYPDRKVKFDLDDPGPTAQNFIVFSQILIFEEIIDYFNKLMAKDEALHPIIRQINAIHHQDESRHIAFGRELVKLYFDQTKKALSTEKLASVQTFIQRHMIATVEGLYNPAVYRDAGLPEPYKMRTELLADPVCQARNRKFLKRTVDFYINKGILPGRDFLP